MIAEIIREIEKEIETRKNGPDKHDQVDVCFGLNRARDIVKTVGRRNGIEE